METLISTLLTLLGFYLLIGFIFGVIFAFAGAKHIDPSAASGAWGFKLLIIPGCAIFWPYLLKRWIGKSAPPDESSAHRRSAAKP